MKSSKLALTAAILTAALFTCEKVPDYCGKGAWYDPDVQFCFGNRAYPLCKNGKYNPLTNGCEATSGLVGALCSDGSVVPSGTPCGGYTLTTAAFPASGGTLVPTRSNGPTFAAGEKAILVAQANDDYIFAGWSGAQPDDVFLAGNLVTASYLMKGGNSQVSIAAVFKPAGKGKLIAEAFPKEGGTITLSPNKDTYSDEYVTVTAVKKPGYEFIGWSGADTSKNAETRVFIDDSKTLVAMFTPLVHTLIAKANPSDGGAVFINGNAVAGNASQDVAATIVILAVEAEGFRFKEWSGTPSVTFGDPKSIRTTVKLSNIATVTANFERGNRVGSGTGQAVTYTLAVNNPVGGSVTLNPVGGTYNVGTTVTATAVADSGYIFTKWSGAAADSMADPTANTASVLMDKNTSLAANFRAILRYTITFNANDGTLSGGATAVTDTEGKLLSMPNDPIRNGYTFNGWYTAATGGTKIAAGDMFTLDTTLYAQWTANIYTITFNANGGTLSGDATAATDTEGKLSSMPNNPTRSGYTFSGWYTAATGGTKIEAGDMFTLDTTVYAQWTANIYTITFNANGGSVSPASGTTNNGYLASLPTPARSGYTFNGWYTATSGGTQITTSYVFSSNTTVYAQWTSNSTVGGGDNNCTSGTTCKSKKMPNGKTWMTENLNIETADSWCYLNRPDSCAKYGRLYTWSAAMAGSSSSSSRVQGVCPSGWHLPSKQEWQSLVDYVGGSSVAGKKLKSQSGWYNNGNGTDDFGFSALPGGYRYDGSFESAGCNGGWWMATDDSYEDSYYRGMGCSYDWLSYDIDYEYNDDNRTYFAFSVRCVQD
ncbi:hypothetical protein R80B4_03253 [Fibrobacteres bacterium R8-0-B4]